ncbi:MAG: response regulator [SAR324 cluster bacterium]|nr:response regulator [SAR324 cluster bacterium]
MDCKKVLIVDDEKPHRDIVRASLKGKTVTISELSSGQGFHEAIEAFQPDLVLIDFQMPIKDGVTLCKELKEYDQTTSIVFLSSELNQDMVKSLKEIGVDDCWSKPITPAQLKEKLSHWILEPPIKRI